MIKAVIFDFDGTLLDTESCAYEAFGGLYAEHGHVLPLEQWALGIGTHGSPFDPYVDLQARTGLTMDREALKARFEAELLAKADCAELRPGVVEVLEEAKSLGLSIGLASSADRAWVERHLEAKGIRKYFEALRTSDDVEKVKPDPALYLLAAEALGVKPEEAVAFEDSLNGMKAAVAAGMPVVVVPNPMTRHMDFAAARADLIIESLADQPLRAVLDRIGTVAKQA
ncbi:HAD family hydrolase [Cohnella candidum]|uniref:HAD family hydrolase n=1 Tax=Cohnella candidum TaxID=2674991 RepID=A0A3G3K045_9BACL|nr:HAD-IA family hydrolase [Cohnella candidum]AYQ73876.1 HAD family hydrolase [Cohnella candidum]